MNDHDEKRFSLFSRFSAQCREEFLSHVREPIRKRWEDTTPVTWEEYLAMTTQLDGLNSYERRLLHIRFNDEALLELYKVCMDQIGHPLRPFELAHDYHDAVIREISPTMADRLRAVSTSAAEASASNTRLHEHNEELSRVNTVLCDKLSAANLRVEELDKLNTSVRADAMEFHRRSEKAERELQAIIPKQCYDAGHRPTVGNFCAECNPLLWSDHRLDMAQTRAEEYQREIKKLGSAIKRLCSAAGLSPPHEGPGGFNREIDERTEIIAQQRTRSVECFTNRAEIAKLKEQLTAAEERARVAESRADVAERALSEYSDGTGNSRCTASCPVPRPENHPKYLHHWCRRQSGHDGPHLHECDPRLSAPQPAPVGDGTDYWARSAYEAWWCRDANETKEIPFSMRWENKPEVDKNAWRAVARALVSSSDGKERP